MITRRDAVRLAVLATLAAPLLAACGSDEKGTPSGPDVAGGGELDLVSSDIERAPGDAEAIPAVVAAMHRFAGGVYGALPDRRQPGAVAVLHRGRARHDPHRCRRHHGRRDAPGARRRRPLPRRSQRADRRTSRDWPGGSSAPTEAKPRSRSTRPTSSSDRMASTGSSRSSTSSPRSTAPACGSSTSRPPPRTRGSSSTTGSRHRTHDRIEDLIPEGVLDELTRLVLVNAIYLKAPWEAPFEKQLTETRPVPPRRRDHGRRRPDEQRRAFRAADLGRRLAGGDASTYAGRQLAMTVVLPDEGRLADVEADGRRRSLPDLLARPARRPCSTYCCRSGPSRTESPL